MTSNEVVRVVENAKEESRVKIACCQIEPHVGRKEENVRKTLRSAEEAADGGAGIILLPELANTGYVFEARSEANELSEEVPSGETTAIWAEFARNRGIYLAAGLAERESHRLYNSAVLMGPEGYIGKYRKLHLWNREKLFFEPGNLGLPIFHTPLGRLAMHVCYDMFLPETTRIYALLGADVILCMANIPYSDSVQDSRLVEAIVVAQACSSSIYMAMVNRIGVERELPFLGRSMIVSPSGQLLAGPASLDREEIIFADCNLVEARLQKRWSSLNHVILDRRTDIYDPLLGYDDVPFSW